MWRGMAVECRSEMSSLLGVIFGKVRFHIVATLHRHTRDELNYRWTEY